MEYLGGSFRPIQVGNGAFKAGRRIAEVAETGIAEMAEPATECASLPVVIKVQPSAGWWPVAEFTSIWPWSRWGWQAVAFP
jgi:hypothetical protein